MKVWTDRPGLQFYSGNFMDGSDVGKRGDRHDFRTGIALETQNFPDAPNHDNFPVDRAASRRDLYSDERIRFRDE